MSHTIDHRPSNLARLTGLAYLGIIFTGIFAEFVVRGRLIVDDDPTATAKNIAESPGLFGIGIGADVMMVGLAVIVALGLFGLLRRIDRRRALTTTVLRLVQGTVLAVNLLSLVRALDFAQQAVGADGAILAVPAHDALDAVERHAVGYDVGLIAFGLSCLVLGNLLRTARLVSLPLAVGMSATGLVYLAGSFVAVVAPSLTAAVEPFYVIPLVVELAFAVRLVVRGLDAAAPTPIRPVPVPA
jgi:hypothetical protein